jgi:CRP-like cAMP-binding protein
MNDLSKLLSKNPIFASISKTDFALVIEMAVSRTYHKGEKVILSGEIWPYLFLVGEGVVDAVKESSEGRSLRVTSFCTGDLFWGLAFFHDGAPMPVSLDVREHSQLYLCGFWLFGKRCDQQGKQSEDNLRKNSQRYKVNAHPA